MHNNLEITSYLNYYQMLKYLYHTYLLIHNHPAYLEGIGCLILGAQPAKETAWCGPKRKHLSEECVTVYTQQGSRLCVTQSLVFSMFYSCVRPDTCPTHYFRTHLPCIKQTLPSQGWHNFHTVKVVTWLTQINDSGYVYYVTGNWGQVAAQSSV